jgi:hypothetical protein
MLTRRKRLLVLVLALVVAGAVLAGAAGAATLAGSPDVVVMAKPSPTPTPTAPASLAALATDAAPWLHLEANSLQRSPLYLGSTPRELALGLSPADGGVATLPASLKALGELQLKGIRQSLVAKKTITSKQTLTVEAWPIRDDRGRLTWAFARWRTSASSPWRWLSTADIQNTDPNTFVPETLDPATSSGYTDIFGAPDDYGWNVEPAFSNCIWVERAADAALARCWEAWLPSSQSPAYSQRTDLAGRLALVVPPPARLNGQPVTYAVAATDAKVTWPPGIVWTAEPAAAAPAAGAAVISSWPAGFDAAYRADLLAMDGEAPAVFPLSGRSVTFTNKNNALPDNQLADVFSYLEERYAQTGLRTWRQSFTWRGMPQTNLFAEIPGSNSRLAPLLIADHVDTALDEDLALKGIYQAVPGADDNASASAALLRAAAVLRDRHPQRSIWLVHFTGEEFPADDLGARALVSQLLGDRQDIAGLVLLDMIGFAGVGETQFQINPGPQAASLQMASVALDAQADVSPQLTPLLEPRYSDRSYLYNTDGIILSENGYPVVLINEHINYYTRLMRAAYHDMGDTSDKINFPFAVALTKVAIETTARLAGTN